MEFEYTKPLLKPDEITLHLIASGIIQLSEKRVEEGVGYPYPLPLQRGLDKLTATRLMRKQKPPQSLMELISWCREPIKDWDLELSPEAIGYEDRLLVGWTPTATCDSWAYTGANIEDDITERQFIKGVFEICRSQNNPGLYSQFRGELVSKDNRVLSKLEYTKLVLKYVSSGLKEHISESYSAAPVSARFGTEYHCCSRCGNLLQTNENGKGFCENERCMANGIKVGKRLSINDEPVWLKRPLRRYIADPGIAEIQLKQKLEKLGLHVVLWPNYDQCDLRISAATGRVWLVDVKDWANPFLLAQEVRGIPTETPLERAYYVFPDERNREWSGYAETFNRYAPRSCEGLMMNRFIKQVKWELEQNA